MATKPTRSTRSTRTSKTKAEVMEDFESVASAVKHSEALPAKEAELKLAREAAARKSAEEISPEAITQKLTQAQFSINRTLASVQEQLVQQTQELEQIKQAKAVLQADLEQLHGADKVLLALDTLVQEYQDKNREMETAYQERRKQLEEETATVRKQWEQEAMLHNKQVAERNSELQKLRVREQADYEYNTQQGRKIEHDNWKEQLRMEQIAERDRREALEKNWAARSAEIAAKEQEFAQLKAQVEAFPAKLDAEVKKAEAIAGNSIKREYEHKIQLLSKDAESQHRVLEMQNTALQDVVQKQQATIAELQTRLRDSEMNVKSIAEKALESASSTRTMAEVRTMLHQEPVNGGSRSKA